MALAFVAARAQEATPPRPQDAFRQLDRGALARDRDDKARESVSVRDFCPVVDGTTDNTACIQGAVDRLCERATGGGALLVPRGTYVIDAATGVRVACPGIHVVGQGWGDRDSGDGGSKIVIAGRGDKPIFDFKAPVKAGDRYFYGGGVRDLQFRSSNPAGTVAQRGPMVQFSHCFGCTVEHVYSFNAYRFLVVFAGYQNRVTQFFADQIAFGGEAIKFHGSDKGCEPDNVGNCPTRGDVFEIDHGTVNAALSKGQTPGACIRLSDFAATTMISNVICNQVTAGLNIDCPTSEQIGACPQFISAWDFETEVNGSAGPDQAAAIIATDFVHLNCHDCHLYGYGVTTLVKLAASSFPGASDAQFFGGKVESAGGPCIISAIQGLEWHGGQVQGCGQGTAGFVIQPSPVGGAAASGSTIIEGVRLCWGIGSAPTPMVGIMLQPGTDYAVITGNILRGCTRGIVDRSGGAHTVIANNAGP